MLTTLIWENSSGHLKNLRKNIYIFVNVDTTFEFCVWAVGTRMGNCETWKYFPQGGKHEIN